jgi:Tannase and feruloyl esterase
MTHTRSTRHPFLVLCTAGFAALGLAGCYSFIPPPTIATVSCVELAAFVIPASALSLPHRGVGIASATVVESATALPYCKVLGTIRPVDPTAPNINFQVNLPASWNGKGIHYGGGGYNGSLVSAEGNFRFASGATPLGRGFATFGSDSGHQSAPADGSFALNRESLLNFAGDQLKKTQEVARALMAARYGQPPKRLYFVGNSQGGHEALTAVQRWPRDYDGAIVTHPVYNFTALQLSGNRAAKAMYAPNAWISPAKIVLLDAKVREVCDGLDGLVDGVVANTVACAAAFDIERYRCPGGANSADACFSDAQIAAMKTMNSRTTFDFQLQGNVQGYARWPIFEGATMAGLFGVGKGPVPSVPAKAIDDFGLHVLSDPMIRHFITREAAIDTLAFEPNAWIDRLIEISNLVDASSVALEPFEARGGKMLLMHGSTDFATSVHNTTEYYQRIVDRFGQARADRFLQYYIAPGFAHGGGPFEISWDPLTALDDWVEMGKVPANLIMADSNAATRGRTRPMCRYPMWPRYISGDPNVAASFACTR